MTEPGAFAEIRYKDRPKCSLCNTKMKYACLKVTPNLEVYSWEFDCNCVEATIYAPDITYTLIDGDRIS